MVGGMGLICTHAFATCCVSVCALQTRVLGTLCVPFSEGARALRISTPMSFCLPVFSTGKKIYKGFENFGMRYLL